MLEFSVDFMSGLFFGALCGMLLMIVIFVCSFDQ